MPRKCVNSVNNFCYICGEITFSSQKRNLTPLVKTAYQHYFGMKVGDQDKSWAPHICCNSCSVLLREWLKNKKRSMAFGVPMVWREPTNHIDDCYFCSTPPINAGLSMKKEEQFNIRISHLLFDLYHIQTVYQFLLHLKTMN